VIESHTTHAFRMLFEGLPPEVQFRARRAYKLFRTDPNHPGLQFKKVKVRGNVYSVRIGMGYRALGVLEGSVITWFWIGTHASYDRLT